MRELGEGRFPPDSRLRAVIFFHSMNVSCVNVWLQQLCGVVCYHRSVLELCRFWHEKR